MSNEAPPATGDQAGPTRPEAPRDAPAVRGEDVGTTSARLSRGTIARYATGSLGTGGFATLPGLVLTYYLTDSLGVAALAAGAVITVAKVWDVVIDPVIGALTDRDLARHGSRRRLMVIGALALPVLFALTFAVPPSLGPVVAGIWVLLAFTLTATAFSLFQVPYIALPAELTPRYDERTRLLTWRVVVLTLAILLFGAGGPALRRVSEDPFVQYLVMGVVCGVVIGIGMLVATGVARRAASTAPQPTREREAGTTDAAAGGIREHFAEGIGALTRSRPFRLLLSTFVLQALATGLMLAGAQYVATWVLDSQAAVELLFVALIAPALLAAPAWGVVARRIGKERTFTIASIVFAIAAVSILGMLWAPGDWIYVPVGIAGIAYAGMQSLPMAMLPDVISHDERTHGPGRAGSFSGVWTAGETVGFALGATTLAVILAVTGYVSSTGTQVVEQPDAAITGIVVSFSLAPAVLIALSLLTLARYPLRRADIDHPDTESQPA
ncbi:Na+/melibiose symporter-like transporter [Microbacterium trichothecenolyticum]|uniref:MFS transporter n=1 Tax=Microbacterium trichothecenolyticum TaxID=69370 RepID=UPI0028611AB0|nr:MFS transporter [Microbacterium trichothecenolyticum]MDR7110823.1 Na+/melibiose symporter-like transporter [Microbacterium trichothecenolyticum]